MHLFKEENDRGKESGKVRIFEKRENSKITKRPMDTFAGSFI